MRYGSTNKATEFKPPNWRIKTIKAVLFFIPSANPDHESLYPEVKKWLLELDDDGAVSREVALDAGGRPLFRAPENRNHGFWTDSDVQFSDEDVVAMSSVEFERLWDLARPK